MSAVQMARGGADRKPIVTAQGASALPLMKETRGAAFQRASRRLVRCSEHGRSLPV